MATNFGKRFAYLTTTPLGLNTQPPSAPTNLLVNSNNNGSIVVSCSKPEDNGGSRITGYLYSIYAGVIPPNSPTLFKTQLFDSNASNTIVGLNNGITYSIVAQAINMYGTGPQSLPFKITLYGTPSAPMNLAVNLDSNDGSISVSCTPPTGNGGSPVTGYLYSVSIDDITYIPGSNTISNISSTFVNSYPAPSNTSFKITGLTTGTTYTLEVQAINIYGAGSASLPILIRPYGVPDAPANMVATSGNTNATITFQPPISTGGLDITGYQYSVFNSSNGSAMSGLQNKPLLKSATSFMIQNLINGTLYTVELRVINAKGTGNYASVSVTPSTIPSVVTSIQQITKGDRSVNISFIVPNNGGNPISSYKYSINGATNTILCDPPLVTGAACEFSIEILSYGNNYPLTITCGNINGYGPNNSFFTVYTAPDTPTIAQLQYVSGSGYNISYNSTNTNAVFPITGYKYSVLDMNSNPIDPSNIDISMNTLPNTLYSGSFFIPKLLNGMTYILEVHAINAIGNGDFRYTKIYTTPTEPLYISESSYDTSNFIATISFVKPTNNGGSPITGYQYAIATTNDPTDPSFNTLYVPSNLHTSDASGNFQIPQLTNGIIYYIQLLATNVIGNGIPTNIFQICTAPGIATIYNQNYTPQNEADPNSYGNSIITIQAPLNGGDPITTCQYTIGGDLINNFLIDATATSYQINIPLLVATKTYPLTISFSNMYGRGQFSSTFSICTPPPAPTISQVYDVSKPNVIGVHYIHTIGTSLHYSVYDSSNKPLVHLQDISIRSTNSVDESGNFDIPKFGLFSNKGLKDGSTYIVYVYATNNIGPGASTSLVISTPPGMPIITSGTYDVKNNTGDSTAKLKITVPINGGETITSYTCYMTDAKTPANIKTQIISVPSNDSNEITIGGLTVGYNWYVKLLASNKVGNSVLSDTYVTFFNTTLPSSNFEQKNYTLGYATIQSKETDPKITKYQYSITPALTDFLPVENLDLSNNTFAIPCPMDGIIYYVQIQSYNGSWSALTNAIQLYTTPMAPISISQTSYDPNSGYAYISITPSNNGGSPITGLKYIISTDNVNFNALVGISGQNISNPSTPTGVIPYLSSGVVYYIKLLASNKYGDGPLSNTFTVCTVPDVPRNISGYYIYGTNASTIAFSSFNGGSPITQYQYSLDGGTNFTTVYVDPSTGPSYSFNFTFSGYQYVLQILTYNAYGWSSVACTPVSSMVGSSVPPMNNGMDSYSYNIAFVVPYSWVGTITSYSFAFYNNGEGNFDPSNRIGFVYYGETTTQYSGIIQTGDSNFTNSAGATIFSRPILFGNGIWKGGSYQLFIYSTNEYGNAIVNITDPYFN